MRKYPLTDLICGNHAFGFFDLENSLSPVIKWKRRKENKIPFEITARSDLFFSERNMRVLDESEERYKVGKAVMKTKATEP